MSDIDVVVIVKTLKSKTKVEELFEGAYYNLIVWEFPFLEFSFCLSFPNVLIGNLYDENDLYYGSGDSPMYDRFPIRAFGNDRLRR